MSGTEVDLCGILLVGDQSALESGSVGRFEGILTRYLEIPGSDDDLFCRLARYLECNTLNEERLLELKREIICFWQENGRPVVTVEIPKQDITDGVIQILVIEGRVGEIRVCCNHWFCDDQIRCKVSLEPGDVIESDCLLNDVAWINRNPFRNVDVIFSPGECEGTTDIELITRDRFPLRPYVGGDNAGNRTLGHTRLYGGFSLTNFFGWDDILTYQYTTSTHFSRLKAHSFQYHSYLPWKHEFIAFGGYAEVKVPIDEMMRVEGHDFQASLRYSIPFKPLYKDNLFEFIFGFDYKNTDNNLLFVGDNNIPVVAGTVNITQFMTSISWFGTWTWGTFDFLFEGFGSPGKLMDNQKNSDFDMIRSGAKNRYAYERGLARLVYYTPKNSSVALQAKGQVATSTLLPSEEFGLGGYDTIRGYDERAFNADNAFCLNGEFRLPPVHFLQGGKLDCVNDELLFLLFIDYGYGHNYRAPSGIKKSNYLIGIGPGMRYAINPYLSFRMDWGFKLHRLQFDRDRSKLHLGLMVSY